MLNRSLLFSLALLLTVDAGNYLNANENNKIIYEKDYFNQFNITNINDALKRIPGVENIGSRNSQSYEPGSNKKKPVLFVRKDGHCAQSLILLIP